MAALGLAALRLALAVVFVAHGLHTLTGAWSGPGSGPAGLADTATYLDSLGLSPAFLLAVAIGVVETAGGALVAAGWFTRVAAGLLLALVAASAWIEHARWGFFLNWTQVPDRGHGLEYAIVLAGALACLVLAGAGDWSLDGRRSRRAESRAAGRARIRGRF